MKKTTSINTKKAGPLMNLTIAAILLFTALPIALFGIVQIIPPLHDAVAKTTMEDVTPKRSSAAERSAARREARKAKTELAAANTHIETTVVTPGFGNMAFGGIRVKMTDPGMDGFLGMPGVGFEEVRMIPDKDLHAFGFTPDPPMNMEF